MSDSEFWPVTGRVITLSGRKFLAENDAAAFTGWSVRRFRKFNLPFKPRPERPRTKPNRMYELGVLREWRSRHLSAREVQTEVARQRFTKHGRWQDARGRLRAASEHPLYGRWKHQRSRCLNPSDPDYSDYGGRGIEFYWAWQDDPIAYFAYVESLPRVPGEDSLDRRNNDGHYAPGNMRWANSFVQNGNRRSCLEDGGNRSDCLCGATRRPHSDCPLDAFDWESGASAVQLSRALILSGGKRRKCGFEESAGTVVDSWSVGAGLSKSSESRLPASALGALGVGGDIQSSPSLTGWDLGGTDLERWEREELSARYREDPGDDDRDLTRRMCDNAWMQFAIECIEL